MSLQLKTMAFSCDSYVALKAKLVILFQEPATNTTRRFGPCAPITMVCSMSAVRDGPLIRLIVLGMRPNPWSSRSLAQHSSYEPAMSLTKITTK